MQEGQSVCIFLVFPQAGHLFNAVTSFKAFPARSLCLFFMWDVFFFGTALRIPSQMSPSKPGMLCNAAGIAIASDGHVGYGDRRDCCVKRSVDLNDEVNVVAESRGSRDAMAEAIRSCWTAAIVKPRMKCRRAWPSVDAMNPSVSSSRGLSFSSGIVGQVGRIGCSFDAQSVVLMMIAGDSSKKFQSTKLNSRTLAGWPKLA